MTKADLVRKREQTKRKGVLRIPLGEYRGVYLFVNGNGRFYGEGVGIEEDATSLDALKKKIRLADPDRTDIPKKGAKVAFKRDYWEPRWVGGVITGKRSIETSEHIHTKGLRRRGGTLQRREGVIHVEVKVYRKFMGKSKGEGLYMVPLSQLFVYDEKRVTAMLKISKEVAMCHKQYESLEDDFELMLPKIIG